MTRVVLCTIIARSKTIESCNIFQSKSVLCSYAVKYM